MIEMLVVLAIVAVLLTATAGVTSSINASRSMTGVQQIISACDSARARALKEQRVVFLAFAADTGRADLKNQGILMCHADSANQRASQQGTEPLTPSEELAALIDGAQAGVLAACSEWMYLPEGQVFSDVEPAQSTAGQNFFRLARGQLLVRPPGGAAPLMLPCIGFGSLGQVVYPGLEAGSSGQLLIALAENPDPGTHRPENCRWIGLQRHTGITMILP